MVVTVEDAAVKAIGTYRAVWRQGLRVRAGLELSTRVIETYPPGTCFDVFEQVGSRLRTPAGWVSELHRDKVRRMAERIDERVPVIAWYRVVWPRGIRVRSKKEVASPIVALMPSGARFEVIERDVTYGRVIRLRTHTGWVSSYHSDGVSRIAERLDDHWHASKCPTVIGGAACPDGEWCPHAEKSEQCRAPDCEERLLGDKLEDNGLCAKHTLLRMPSLERRSVLLTDFSGADVSFRSRESSRYSIGRDVPDGRKAEEETAAEAPRKVAEEAVARQAVKEAEAEVARKAGEEEAARKAEAEVAAEAARKIKEEAAAARRATEEAELETARKAAEYEAARKAEAEAAAEAAMKIEEEAASRRAAEEAARKAALKAAEEEAARKAEAEAAAEAARKIEGEAAARRAAEEAARKAARKAAEEDAARKAEAEATAEAARKIEEEAAAKRAKDEAEAAAARKAAEEVEARKIAEEAQHEAAEKLAAAQEAPDDELAQQAADVAAAEAAQKLLEEDTARKAAEEAAADAKAKEAAEVAAKKAEDEAVAEAARKAAEEDDARKALAKAEEDAAAKAAAEEIARWEEEVARAEVERKLAQQADAKKAADEAAAEAEAKRLEEEQTKAAEDAAVKAAEEAAVRAEDAAKAKREAEDAAKRAEKFNVAQAKAAADAEVPEELSCLMHLRSDGMFHVGHWKWVVIKQGIVTTWYDEKKYLKNRDRPDKKPDERVDLSPGSASYFEYDAKGPAMVQRDLKGGKVIARWTVKNNDAATLGKFERAIAQHMRYAALKSTGSASLISLRSLVSPRS